MSNNSFTKCPRTDIKTSSKIRAIFEIVSRGMFTLTLIAKAKAFGPLQKTSAVLWKSKDITPWKANSNTNTLTSGS